MTRKPRHISRPTVSIVVPTYNRGSLLRRALQSVLRQTFSDFEVLVVDDASSEDISGVLAEFDDSRVRYLQRNLRGGGGAARNTGLSHAIGEYIAFLDSDDVWYPNKVAHQLMTFRGHLTKEIGLSCCGFVRLMGRQRRTAVPGLLQHPEIAFEYLLGGRGGPLTASVMMLPRLVVEDGYRFDEDLPALQDYDLAVRLASRYAVVGTRTVLVQKYRDIGGSHVFSSETQRKALGMLLEKHGLWLAERPRAHARYYRDRAICAARLDDLAGARADLGRAVEVGGTMPVLRALILFSYGGASALRVGAALWRIMARLNRRLVAQRLRDVFSMQRWLIRRRRRELGAPSSNLNEVAPDEP